MHRKVTFTDDKKARFDVIYEGLVIGSAVKESPPVETKRSVRKLELSLLEKLQKISAVKICGNTKEVKKYSTGDEIRVLNVVPVDLLMTQEELELVHKYINMMDWRIAIAKEVENTLDWLSASETVDD